MVTYQQLREQRFYQIFQELCAIPHGSGNEKAVSDYIVRFAGRCGLEAVQDSAWNVIVRKPASPAHAAAQPVILQAHIDMVCEKAAGCEHDFLTDSIAVVERDGCLTAAGETTLGADNGVGAAYILAVLEDRSLAHPPIEAVFTTNEETGMDGMAALDATQLRACRMINLDSEEEGELCASCAGGAHYNLRVPLSLQGPDTGAAPFRVAVRGLLGGHSGMDIGSGRANALLLLARLLRELDRRQAFQLAAFSGGAKDNAIPREAAATIWLRPESEPAAREQLQRSMETIRREYAAIETAVELEFGAGAPDHAAVLDRESREKLLAAVLLMPNGVFSYHPTLPGVLDSSSNLGIAAMGEGCLLLTGIARSNTGSKFDGILDRLHLLAGLLGGELEADISYAPWEYSESSPLRALCLDVYRRKYGSEMTVASTHGGLECGLLVQKRPDMDIVSLGPNLHDVHTPQERAEIPSLLHVWEYLLEVLESLTE